MDRRFGGGGKGKGKARRPQKGKGKARRPRKGKGNGRQPLLGSNSTSQPDRAQARTHARSARHGTKRFSSWTHPPTSDYCMFLISVSVLSWRDEWAIITGPNMPILRFRGDSLVDIANLPCRGPIEPKRVPLLGGGGGPRPKGEGCRLRHVFVVRCSPTLRFGLSGLTCTLGNQIKQNNWRSNNKL